MTDAASHYAAAAARITAVVTDLDATALATRVAACPEWTVRDIIGHLAGAAKDVTSNNTAGAPGWAWTNAQVESRASLPLQAVLQEWQTLVPVVEAFVGRAPAIVGTILVNDVTAHEHDVLGALGRIGDRDGDTVRFAFENLLPRIGAKLTEAGKPALKVVAAGQEYVAGEGEPMATITGSPFEFIRAFTGRRSPDQLRALFTAGDPEPFLDSMSVFEPRPEPLIE